MIYIPKWGMALKLNVEIYFNTEGQTEKHETGKDYWIPRPCLQFAI